MKVRGSIQSSGMKRREDHRKSLRVPGITYCRVVTCNTRIRVLHSKAGLRLGSKTKWCPLVHGINSAISFSTTGHIHALNISSLMQSIHNNISLWVLRNKGTVSITNAYKYLHTSARTRLHCTKIKNKVLLRPNLCALTNAPTMHIFIAILTSGESQWNKTMSGGFVVAIVRHIFLVVHLKWRNFKQMNGILVPWLLSSCHREYLPLQIFIIIVRISNCSKCEERWFSSDSWRTISTRLDLAQTARRAKLVCAN